VIIQFHDGFSRPTTLHVTRVVLTDDLGNPIMAAVDHGDKSFSVTHISEGQEAFQKGLKDLGIHKTVIIEDLQEQPDKLRDR
jgi:hypothetical protein